MIVRPHGLLFINTMNVVYHFKNMKLTLKHIYQHLIMALPSRVYLNWSKD